MLSNPSVFPKITNELKFVLKCTDSMIPIETDQINSLDWNKVFRLSLVHRLYPLLFKTLKQQKSPLIPEYLIENLKPHSLKNGLNVINITEEIVRITKYMKSFGVTPIILKGPALSVRIGEDITLRPSGDIDILVDALEFNKAETLLEDMDYRRIVPDFPLTQRQRSFYLKNGHHFEYYNEKRSILVELHWRIRSYNTKRFPPASEININTLDINGSPVYVMDDAYWFIFLMIHGYKHKWERLRWLYDIKMIIHHGVNWDKIIYLADNSEVMPVLHQTIILLNELYSIEFPDALFISAINDTKAWQLAYIVMEQFACENDSRSSSLHDLSSLNEYSMKNATYYNYNSKPINYFFYMLSKFYPTETEFKHVTLPDALFPLYYFIKPFYWLFCRAKSALHFKND